MGNRIIIQVLLIVALLVLMAALFNQRQGARPLAIRRLTYGVLLLAAIAAVIFPGWLTSIAQLLGVGRGTDLLLYGLVLVFISHSMASKSKHAAEDQRFTLLARQMAINAAEPADQAGKRLSSEAESSS